MKGSDKIAEDELRETLLSDLNETKLLQENINSSSNSNTLLIATNYIQNIYKRYDIPKTFYQIFNGIDDTTPKTLNEINLNLYHCIKIINSVLNAIEYYELRGDKIDLKRSFMFK